MAFRRFFLIGVKGNPFTAKAPAVEVEAVIVETGVLIARQANFTYEFERDYIDNARGPANHTAYWEHLDGHVSSPTTAAIEDLPEDLYEIERSTWNTKRVNPVNSRPLERDDARFELNRGQVEAYLQNGDGLRTLRKWRIPSTPYTGYVYDEGSKAFGVLRSVDEVSTDSVEGQYGELRRLPGELGTGGPWGVVRAVYKETSNLRVEYRRRGKELSSLQGFEIPDRYVTYIRFFAMWKAYEQEGKGQELELATHYKALYEAGVARMRKRQSAMNNQRQYIMGGGTSNRRSSPPRARLPYQYGQVVR